MNEKNCMLTFKCKKAGDPGQCNNLCYPFIRLHGEDGSGGVVGVANIPPAYRRSLTTNIPFKEDNPEASRVVILYSTSVIEQVNEGVGLYLYGTPNTKNPRGCGNGKTTAATAILNEYLVARVILDVKKVRRIDDVAGLFLNVSKYQNQFNAQFRGARDMQEDASRKYYGLKELMLRVPLLVMDDIGVRDATEAFRGEFYQVIDDRVCSQLATVYTSNVPIEGIAKVLDDRIASRIAGSTMPVPFVGEDKRKVSL